MDISKIFLQEHSNELSDTKRIRDKDIIEFIKDKGFNPIHFYKVTNQLHPFAYINKTVYVEIYGFTDEIWDMLQLQKRIDYMNKTHKECIDNKDYSRLFCLIDKPFRFYWYKELFDNIPDKDKYEIFMDIYTGSEYGFSSLGKEFVKKIFTYKKDKVNIPIDDEVLTIYRGEGSLSTPYHNAYSWTLNYDVAHFFATRFRDNGIIYKANIRKDDVLEYLIDGDEQEILVYADKLFNIEVIDYR